MASRTASYFGECSPLWKAERDSIRFGTLAGKNVIQLWGRGGGGCGLVGAARCGASLFLFFVMESASNPIRPPLPYQVVECFFPGDLLQLGRGALPRFRYELKHNLSFWYFFHEKVNRYFFRKRN